MMWKKGSYFTSWKSSAPPKTLSKSLSYVKYLGTTGDDVGLSFPAGGLMSLFPFFSSSINNTVFCWMRSSEIELSTVYCPIFCRFLASMLMIIKCLVIFLLSCSLTKNGHFHSFFFSVYSLAYNKWITFSKYPTFYFCLISQSSLLFLRVRKKQQQNNLKMTNSFEAISSSFFTILRACQWTRTCACAHIYPMAHYENNY